MAKTLCVDHESETGPTLIGVINVDPMSKAKSMVMHDLCQCEQAFKRSTTTLLPEDEGRQRDSS